MVRTDNAKYVSRGRMLVPHGSPERETDLKAANRRKNGAPFLYADSLFACIAIARSMAQIPCRQLAGMASETVPGVPMPCHAAMFRRIRDLSVQAVGGMATVTAADGAGHSLCAVGGTGIKAGSRGERMRQKWKVRRGFVRMHALADTDAGMILALGATDDTVGDSKTFVPLLEDAVGEGRTVSVLAGGAYASRDIRRECRDRGVRPLIRLKASPTAGGGGKGDARGLAVRDQLGGSPESPVGALTDRQKEENQREWKGRVGYGRRWIVEIVFSAFKRVFGESAMASKWENMVHEIMPKAAAYNLVTARGGWN